MTILISYYILGGKGNIGHSPLCILKINEDGLFGFIAIFYKIFREIKLIDLPEYGNKCHIG